MSKLKQNKFRNKWTVVDGIKFQSVKESARYLQLKTMQQAGLICNLKLQHSFSIQLNNVHICRYIADFVYWTDGCFKMVVEDVKSDYTRKLPVYRLKKRLMKVVMGIEILES